MPLPTVNFVNGTPPPINGANLNALQARFATYADPRVVVAGNLGATPTLTIAGDDREVWMTGTLTANAALTISGLATVAIVRLLLLQDGTGGRTLSVNGTTVTVNATASSPSIMSCYFDGTNLWVNG